MVPPRRAADCWCCWCWRSARARMCRSTSARGAKPARPTNCWAASRWPRVGAQRQGRRAADRRFASGQRLGPHLRGGGAPGFHSPRAARLFWVAPERARHRWPAVRAVRRAGRHIPAWTSSANLGRFCRSRRRPPSSRGPSPGAPRACPPPRASCGSTGTGRVRRDPAPGAATQTLTVRPPLDRVATSAVAGFEACNDRPSVTWSREGSSRFQGAWPSTRGAPTRASSSPGRSSR